MSEEVKETQRCRLFSWPSALKLIANSYDFKIVTEQTHEMFYSFNMVSIILKTNQK